MMREKHRYVLVESGTDVEEREREDFAFGLRNALLHCIGESNYHRANPRIVEFVRPNMFIIRSSLWGCGQVVAALALIKRVNERDSYFYTLKSSGTLKALGASKP